MGVESDETPAPQPPPKSHDGGGDSDGNPTALDFEPEVVRFGVSWVDGE